MVYRGKPSAGCENCRKAKKRCDLELPACTRCRKLQKDCGGYRDVNQLQIQDESQAVIQKANRHKHRASATPASPTRSSSGQAKVARNTSVSGRSIARTPESAISCGTVALSYYGNQSPAFVEFNATVPEETSESKLLTFTMKPTPDDLGKTYFFSQFTSESGHWAFLRDYQKRASLNPVLSYATKACGLAALANVHGVQKGGSYSRTLYAQALSLLNAALRDPRQSRTDESLIAVAMLGYFENITCDSRESIDSWKAHIRGSTQLLKLRGKAQFNTAIGRMLFRETRAQILINLIWDDLEPPAFLMNWNDDLQKLTPDAYLKPADDFTMITCEFAKLRYRMRVQTISHADAMALATDIEMQLVKWSADLMSTNPFWRYREVEVPDSPHIWNGLVHVYNGHPSASVWGTYRNIRIMLTRTQESLVQRLGLSPEQQEKQMNYLKSVRCQMTDEICLGIPTQLGHAPCTNSPHILITAYGSIWPLFFAGTCALERIGPGLWSTVLQEATPNLEATTSAALAQAMWIIGRMEYISKVVGLRWADGVAATLRGDFAMHEELLPAYGDADGKSVHMFWRERLAEMRRNQVPEWVKKIQESGRGPRVTMEENAPLSTGIMKGSYPEGLWGGRVEVDGAKKYRAHSMDISSIINN